MKRYKSLGGGDYKMVVYRVWKKKIQKYVSADCESTVCVLEVSVKISVLNQRD